MKALVEFLRDGCFHRWQEDSGGYLTYMGIRVGRYYILRCQKCGNYKKESVA